MPRLIDADELLAECKEAQKSDPNADGRGWANHFLNAAGEPSTEWYCVEDMIENAPTIDAVLVVRCKECKWHNELGGWDGKGYCQRPSYASGLHGYCYGKETPPDWYCADAERKEDEKDGPVD